MGNGRVDRECMMEGVGGWMGWMMWGGGKGCVMGDYGIVMIDKGMLGEDEGGEGWEMVRGFRKEMERI